MNLQNVSARASLNRWSCMCVIFSNISFHVSFQIASLNICKVTIVADVQNVSIKWFLHIFSNHLLQQIQSHISRMCVIFSNVSFHMYSQIAHLNRYKVTIVADVQNFSIVPQKPMRKYFWVEYAVRKLRMLCLPARFYSEISDFQNCSVWVISMY